MIYKFNPAQASSDPTPTPAQLDLLAALLSSENAVCPWNPADSDAAAYLDEQTELLEAFSESEMTLRSQKFYAHLEQLWSQFIPNSPNLSDAHNHSINAKLHQRFGAYVPSTWLSAIAHQVKHVSTAPLAEQLVQCVGVLVSSLTEADLLTLARPFACTMYTTDELVKFVLGYVQQRDWTDLSEVEHAKLALAIARYAFQVAESSDDREQDQ